MTLMFTKNIYLDLTGDDLIALGLKPGPALGRLLAEIREQQLQGELKTPDEAREWLRRRL